MNARITIIPAYPQSVGALAGKATRSTDQISAFATSTSEMDSCQRRRHQAAYVHASATRLSGTATP